jgi:lysozyme family protein
METYLLLKFANNLDNQGYYQDAEIIDNVIRTATRTRRVPNYKNIALDLSPIVAIMLAQYLHTHNIKQPQYYPKPAPIAAPIEKPIETITRGDYEGFVDFLNKEEGGFSNRKKTFDRGGATYKGITQKVYNRYRAHKKLPKQSVKNMSDIERNEIIKEKYWNPIKASYLPHDVAMALADWRFNGGNGTKKLQKILNLPITGTMDKNTVNAVWKYTGHDAEKDKQLALMLISARKKYLESLKTTRHHKKVPLIHYNQGWYNRLKNLKKNF